MATLTTHQQWAHVLFEGRQLGLWPDQDTDQPLLATYQALRALGVDCVLRLGNFPVFVASHNCEYAFCDGALEVDGVLMDLHGKVGEEEIATRLREAVGRNSDLSWVGPVSWEPAPDHKLTYAKSSDHQLTPSQFRHLVDLGVVLVQAWQLDQVSAPCSSSKGVRL